VRLAKPADPKQAGDETMRFLNRLHAEHQLDPGEDAIRDTAHLIRLGSASPYDKEHVMSNRIHLLALTGLLLAAALALSGCKEKPLEARHQEAVALSQVPAPVKALHQG
jgi:hypothetical protein